MDNDNCPLIVCGHQPELFHPGVWAKNFLLDSLVHTTDGIGLNLIVDNDALASTHIAIPVGSKERPAIEHVPFDAEPNTNTQPAEEVVIRDALLFRSFADRATSALNCWPVEPLVCSIWPTAVAMLSREPFEASANGPQSCRLSDVLTAARRRAERSVGLCNLELPMSQLSQTEAFAWFVGHLLADVRRLHATYNEVVETYRRVNHVRSSSQPVPNLMIGLSGGSSNATTDDWLEVPFWIWKAGDSRRGRLFVKQTTTELLLANEFDALGSLPLSSSSDPSKCVLQLREMMSRGLKIRTRALTTTMFARVFLGDAFLHGLGGAKYDEMTDRLIARLFGVAPPAYLTMTATAHLPIPCWGTTPLNEAQLRHRLWDLSHNVERHVTSSAWTSSNRGEAESLLVEKQQLVAEQLEKDARPRSHSDRREKADNFQRCRRLRTINQRLTQLAETTQNMLAEKLQTARNHLAANDILRSREFSFCLFSADVLIPLLNRLSH